MKSKYNWTKNWRKKLQELNKISYNPESKKSTPDNMNWQEISHYKVNNANYLRITIDTKLEWKERCHDEELINLHDIPQNVVVH